MQPISTVTCMDGGVAARPTLPDLARFSNHVGAPLEAMLWKPMPMMPSDPLVAKIEDVSLARAKVWFCTARPPTETTSSAR